jgi:hypothetical protein
MSYLNINKFFLAKITKIRALISTYFLLLSVDNEKKIFLVYIFTFLIFRLLTFTELNFDLFFTSFFFNLLSMDLGFDFFFNEGVLCEDCSILNSGEGSSQGPSGQNPNNGEGSSQGPSGQEPNN